MLTETDDLEAARLALPAAAAVTFQRAWSDAEWFLETVGCCFDNFYANSGGSVTVTPRTEASTASGGSGV